MEACAQGSGWSDPVGVSEGVSPRLLMGPSAQTTPSARRLPRPSLVGCVPCTPPPWLLRPGGLSLPLTQTWGSASSPLLPGKPRGMWEGQGQMETEARLRPRETSLGTVLPWSCPLDVTPHIGRHTVSACHSTRSVDVAHGRHTLTAAPSAQPRPCPPHPITPARD